MGFPQNYKMHLGLENVFKGTYCLFMAEYNPRMHTT